MAVVKDHRIINSFCGCINLKTGMLIMSTIRITGALLNTVLPIKNHLENCDPKIHTTCRVTSYNEFISVITICIIGIILVLLAILASIANCRKLLFPVMIFDAIQMLVLPFISWFIIINYDNTDYGNLLEPIIVYIYLAIIIFYWIIVYSRSQEIKTDKKNLLIEDK
ncbi:uncharacterized protein LOC103573003 [Microplitis demolitor]|uniref:uncharacterized protein LOC103573003 n=1 Tax=Microplitis demolitor TaxID=69319 RepID=UPI0004CD848F|nr:uncharacterized protein LOC103573003 [Microplitis demolitor]